MLEFLRFIKSLTLALINYIYFNYLNKLRNYYSILATKIIKNQRGFIIWPLSITFILSYPAIYSILTNSHPLESSYIIDLQSLGTNTNYNDYHYNLSLKQIWLIPNEIVDLEHHDYYPELTPGALEKDFLMEALQFQNKLLEGIPFENNASSVSIHTPLQFWDNNYELLKSDKNHLKTINKKTIKSSSGTVILHNGLFSGVVKVNGLIRSAESIRILILYKSSENYGAIWDHNLSALKNLTTTHFRVASDAIKNDQHFLLNLSKLSYFDHTLLTTCYSLMALYCIISLRNLKNVRSRLGLFIAYLAETVLAIMSSATLTTYLFQGVDFYQIPLQLLPFVVIVVGIENTFRLVSSVSKTPGELSIPYRISKSLTDCGLTSTLIVLTNLVLLRIVYPYVGQDTQEFFIFASIALVIDHLLHLTYFTSILSIDIHRLELRDLINDNNSSSNNHSIWLKIFGDKHSLLDDDCKDPNNSKDFIGNLLFHINKIELPFSTTVTGTIISIIFLIGLNIRWTSDSLRIPIINAIPKSSTSQLALEYLHDLEHFLDKKAFSSEVIQILGTSQGLSNIHLSLFPPNIASTGVFVDRQLVFTTNVAYRFDFFYVLEFLTLLIFILSISLIILRYFTSSLTSEYEEKTLKRILEKEHTFQTKVLSGGHVLDVIRTATSNSPFIVSVGLDHRVLVWSPVSQPMPQPSQLPISNQLWPITHFVLSDHGNFIAIFSKTGVVQCYSRYTMTWIWKYELPELKGGIPLEAFFRHKTIPAFLQRKRANDLLKNSSKPSSRRNSMRSIASPKLKATLAFGNNSSVTQELEELIIVLKTGSVITVSCEDGSIAREKLSNSILASSTKLITPRVNDRLISCTQEGNILVSTAVNNKWKSRIVNVIEDRFNNPKTPTSPTPKFSSKFPSSSNNNNDEQPKVDFAKSTITIVPFVGFFVRTNSSFAELIDVQTGILIKRFEIRPFKRGTFKVFHDQPTHCRFCGSASIESFSVAYTLAETRLVRMHTFRADHRAKTSICLRVERDPREIRCVGFNQVAETQYELDDIEGWCSTDKNEIMGIKRKSEEQIAQSVEESKYAGLRNRHSDSRHFNDEHAPRLYNLWEGWTMTADGKVEFYDIPDTGTADGLLVNSVGQINKFGHKSIVVVFGNIMKILYLGNDDLIYQEEEKVNEEISGLSFVNRRRKHLKKADNSANFGEVSSIPGLSELAL